MHACECTKCMQNLSLQSKEVISDAQQLLDISSSFGLGLYFFSTAVPACCD